MVEQQAFNLTAKGSSPLGPTAGTPKRKEYLVKDIEAMTYNNGNNNSRRKRQHFSGPRNGGFDKPEGPEWRIVATRVKGQAAVQVSELPLPVPRYSFRVGTANFTEDEVHVKQHLTVFNYREAAELLLEVGQKYEERRKEDIEEREELRNKWENKDRDA